MESDNSVKKLVAVLEPLVQNLDDLKNQLSQQKDELENVSRFLAYTKDNLEMVGIYADQDLITNMLDKLECSKDDYKASCYLLKSEDENVKKLPQYKAAVDLINNIIEFFKINKAELIVGNQELSEECSKKEIEKKYYDILLENKPYIKDVNEFKELLNTHDLVEEDKIDILLNVIKSNISNYESGNK